VPTFPGFTPALFQFYAELESHNHRDWWQANKDRYEDEVRSPALGFIDAMGQRLGTISPHFVAVPKKVGGSLMRPYRDTRFSKDKTPYKTNVGIQFRHERGKDVHAPGLYLHISTEELFLGAGIWHPDKDALAAIRGRIVERPQEWVAARDDAGFGRTWRLGGESLQRPPRGFDKQHPLIEDLKRKDHIAVADLDIDDVLGPEAVDGIAEAFARSRPYLAFLCAAIGLEF
jgi:uncharacterized protein (TIGR02453 family)